MMYQKTGERPLRTHEPTTSRGQSPWRSPWVMAWITVILVVLFVNVTMVYLAVGTNPGLVAEDYYERGQNYENTIIARQAKFSKLVTRVELPPQARVHEPASLRFVATDKSGAPLKGSTVTLFAYRPSDAGADFSVPMVTDEAGGYRAEIAFPLKGAWDLIISLRQGQDEFNVARRVTVASAD